MTSGLQQRSQETHGKHEVCFLVTVGKPQQKFSQHMVNFKCNKYISKIY